MVDDNNFVIEKTPRFAVLSVRKTVANKYVWLTERVAAVTNRANVITFDSTFQQTVETDIEKCRLTRARIVNEADEFWLHSDHLLEQTNFKILSSEQDLKFDVMKYQLREAFLAMLGHGDDFFLETLHFQFQNDRGRRGNRNEKKALLNGLLIKPQRLIFQTLYDHFVREFIIPYLRNEVFVQCDDFYYQSFPCVRVVRPNEFSIGPHSDASYGFSQANINFYLPLTRIWGTNSLILESSPGCEDWHTINGGYGDIKVWGNSATASPSGTCLAR